VWYTLDAGCVTEVYYPTIDTPQIRDLNSSSPTAKTFFHERRNFTFEAEPDGLSPAVRSLTSI
jgi:glucoamylase